jgi:hypothetical protein
MIYAMQCTETGRFKVGISADAGALHDRLSTVRISNTTVDLVLGTRRR